MIKIIVTILIIYTIIIIGKGLKIVNVLAAMLAAVLMWKGMWDLGSYVDTKFKIVNNPLLSGILSLSFGLLTVYLSNTKFDDIINYISNRF